MAGPMTSSAHSGSGISLSLKQRNATSNMVLLMPPSYSYMMAMDHTLLMRCCVLPKRTTLSCFDYPPIPPITHNLLMLVSSALFSGTGWKGVMMSWNLLDKKSTLWISSENVWKFVTRHSLKTLSRLLGERVESFHSIITFSWLRISQPATAHQPRAISRSVIQVICKKRR